MIMTGTGELVMRDERGHELMRVRFAEPHPQLTISHGLDRNVAVQALAAWLDRAMRDIRTGYPVR